MLEIQEMTNRIPKNTDWEWFLRICRSEPVHSRRRRVRSRAPDAGNTSASLPELRAISQFDAGRWKLRLERVPISIDKQFTGPVASSIAVGFTMLSPLVFLIAMYLWAWVIG